jgi:hypothetical protein
MMMYQPAKAPKRGQFRISLIHYHPWTKQAKVIVSQWNGTRWQLVRSSLDKPTADHPAIQGFLAWAKWRYPGAIVREMK